MVVPHESFGDKSIKLKNVHVNRDSSALNCIAGASYCNFTHGLCTPHPHPHPAHELSENVMK